MTIPEENVEQHSEPIAASAWSIPPPPTFAPDKIIQPSPSTVVVLAIIFFIGAVLEFTGIFPALKQQGILKYLCLIESLLFCVADFIIGVGLLQRRASARVWAIRLLISRAGVMMTLGIYTTLHGNNEVALPIVVRVVIVVVVIVMLLVIYGAIIFFLTRPNVKAACTR